METHIPTIGELIDTILIGGVFFSVVALNIYHFVRGFFKDDNE